MTLLHDDYTIAWICALPLEMTAAKVMLDETYDPLPQPSTDHNSYTLGCLAGHNIVIACLPSGVYGTISAATVLSHMLSTFQCLRFGLMVGIGGGVPSKNVDIRLGDVVVSLPNAISGGVIQYDFGKTLLDGHFQRTGSLNKPPQLLLTAISQMRSNDMIGQESVSSIMCKTLQEKRKLRKTFSRPNHDRLFKAKYEHLTGSSCSQCDQSRLINRAPRKSEHPSIHYGLIASGNQVLKDATRRDSLADEMGILCFEMEAAGLMDQLPCLVIRGICDYCDSHKNKKWQPYAAFAAAAYTKSLLGIVPPHENTGGSRIPSPECHWMVSFPKNPRFVGREDELARIEELMATPSSKAAICGLGGVGKTQIALEVAYRMRERGFGSIFWISCTSNESVKQAYLEIAQMVGIGSIGASEVMSSVRDYLNREESGGWLLIFDNADDIDMWSRSSESNFTPLVDYLPHKEQGHILFTTRNRKVAVLLASSHVVHLAEPRPDAAVRIFEKLLIDKSMLEGNEHVTLQLLEQLASLPLAIAQAAAYINENKIGLPEYLALLQDQEADVIELLSEDFGDDWRYKDVQNPVATTWLISFQQIMRSNELAADYLLFMACILPRDIPKSLLPEAASKKKRTDALGLLKAFSFLSEQDESLSLHRLVHLSTRNWLRKQCRFHQQISSVAERFDAVFPDENQIDRKLWRRYLPHILSLSEETVFPKEQHLDLLERAGRCFVMDGRGNEAASMFMYILPLCKEIHGGSHRQALTVMFHLGRAYYLQGRFTDAERLDLQCHGASEKALGQEHPNTVNALAGLAVDKLALGKFEEAVSINTWLLEYNTREFGPEHPRTMVNMVNQVVLYKRLGRIDEAKSMLEKSVATTKRVLGEEHPDTLETLILLLEDYVDDGKSHEVIELGEKLTAIQKRVLGPHHPSFLTAESLTSVGYARLGRFADMEELQLRRLETWKQVYGAERVETLYAMEQLADTWWYLGKKEDAQSMWQACEELRDKASRSGPDHPISLGLKLRHDYNKCMSSKAKDEPVNKKRRRTSQEPASGSRSERKRRKKKHRKSKTRE